MSAHEDAVTFANQILGEWDAAMDVFFRRVETKARAYELTNQQVRQALSVGYGYEVGDAWDEWSEE